MNVPYMVIPTNHYMINEELINLSCLHMFNMFMLKMLNSILYPVRKYSYKSGFDRIWSRIHKTFPTCARCNFSFIYRTCC
jgi:hypothetical protein